MVTQSFNSFIRSAQKKMLYGNINDGELDEQKRADRFYFEGLDMLKKSIVEQNVKYRVLGIGETILFLLKCFDVDFTKSDLVEFEKRSYPEQIYSLCLALLRAMNVDIKNTLHELVKHHASLNRGYYDKDKKFVKYRAVGSIEEVGEECEEVEGGYMTKKGEFVNQIYYPNVIYK